MAKRLHDWCDTELEQLMGTLLRVGVILAAAFVLAGAGVFLLHHSQSEPRYQIFRGEPADLRSVSLIVRGMISLQGREIIQFGLLLLIATPVARVTFSVAAFTCQRDRTYVMVTLIVLSLLLYSLIAGYV